MQQHLVFFARNLEKSLSHSIPCMICAWDALAVLWECPWLSPPWEWPWPFPSWEWPWPESPWEWPWPSSLEQSESGESRPEIKSILPVKIFHHSIKTTEDLNFFSSFKVFRIEFWPRKMLQLKISYPDHDYVHDLHVNAHDLNKNKFLSIKYFTQYKN